MERTGAGRYAPSPTGDLHLGNLRTAVLAWLFARSTGRSLWLRWEDLDSGRVRRGTAERQDADLRALGLTFDGTALVQSKRREVYAAALATLTRAGRTYECFCTRREIAEAASAPHGRVGFYPGTCRALSRSERDERRTVRSPAIRLRGDGVLATVTDLLHGEVSEVVDDLVLWRNDGGAAYHLAVVVDDIASGVDQIVRGADLLPAAPGQAYLTRLLGGTPAHYAHVPLALNSSGRRLAKRDGAVTLADLAARGVDAAEVLQRIAVSLDLAAPGEPVDLPLLLRRFDPAALPREPWIVEAAD